MSKVTVIIPIYNVEEYLSRCLDSVINQTYKNLEIICVNDCSPDNSAKILEDYSKKDNRIKIINREKNGGLSAARNSGLEVATGDYVYFIDSDDWIDHDYIEKMVGAAVRSKSKVILNTNIVNNLNNEDIGQFFPNKTRNKFIGNAKANSCIHSLIWNTWAHLWEKSFLDATNARFPEGYILEDMYFQAITFPYIEEISVIRGSQYHYRLLDNSIVGKLSNNENESMKSHIKILDKIYDYYETNNLLDNVEEMKFINTYIMADNYVCDDEVIKQLYNYFKRIEPYIYQHKNWYGMIELEYFNDVLQDKNIVKTKNYKKRFVVQEIRNKMKVKI